MRASSTTYGLNRDKTYGFNSDKLHKCLENADISANRGIELQPGEKRPKERTKWRNVDLPPVSDIRGDYAVRTGNGLVVFDVDDYDALSEDIQQFLTDNPTFTVQSPHSEGKDGHYYIATDSNLNKNPDGLEIQGEGAIVVGPGSTLTDCKHGCCTPESPGEYTIKHDRPIASVPGEEIDRLIPEKHSADLDGTTELDSLPDIPDDRRKMADTCLRTIQRESTAFFNDLTDRLNGGRGDMGEALNRNGSGRIDRSQQDFVTVEHLYGVFRYHDLSDQEAKRLAHDYYSHCCRENPYTKDGQGRKWRLRGEAYRQGIVRHASRRFDESEFRRLMNKTTGALRDINEYSEITYRYAVFVLDWLIEEYPPEEAEFIAEVFGLEIERGELAAVYDNHLYQDTTPFDQGGRACKSPTPKQVREVCAALDSRSVETYGTVLQRMRREGDIKLAYLGGNDYRVYPTDHQDPAGAEWVKCGGEEYEPVAKVVQPVEAEI